MSTYSISSDSLGSKCLNDMERTLGSFHLVLQERQLSLKHQIFLQVLLLLVCRASRGSRSPGVLQCQRISIKRSDIDTSAGLYHSPVCQRADKYKTTTFLSLSLLLPYPSSCQSSFTAVTSGQLKFTASLILLPLLLVSHHPCQSFSLSFSQPLRAGGS